MKIEMTKEDKKIWALLMVRSKVAKVAKSYLTGAYYLNGTKHAKGFRSSVDSIINQTEGN